MNEFKRRRIGKGPAPSERTPVPTSVTASAPEAPRDPKTISQILINAFQKHYVWGTILLVVFIAMGKTTWNVAINAEEFTVKEIVLSAFSQKVETDVNNHTNILLLGTGTSDHDGLDLTDTIMVASIDHDNDLVSMLSIPRDLYVEVQELGGGSRINSILALVGEQKIYQIGLTPAEEEQAYKEAYELLVEQVEQIINIDIQYYARIDFKGFTEVVDAIGGIDLYVENDLVDPFYPAENGIHDYETFSVSAGLQHLDGDTALRFTRSRKTTSDFDRAARQQQVMQAIKDKALSIGILSSPGKLKDLYNAFQANFDTNLEWDEIAYLAKIAGKFDRTNVKSWVLNDNPLTEGGFLYTPDRELYQGAFVLIPYIKDNTDIHRFADLILMHPEVHQNALTYQILNGTKSNGLATQSLYYLGRFGFDIVRWGNAAKIPIEKTRIIPRSALLAGQTPEDAAKNPELQYLHKNIIPVGEITTEVPPEYAPAVWESQTDVIIELGQDYVNWMNANLKYFY